MLSLRGYKQMYALLDGMQRAGLPIHVARLDSDLDITGRLKRRCGQLIVTSDSGEHVKFWPDEIKAATVIVTRDGESWHGGCGVVLRSARD